MSKINEDAVTKFEAMEEVLENLDGEVTEVGNSIHEVFIMIETQVGQLVGRPMGSKEEYPRQPQGPKTVKATQTHSGEMEDYTKETTKITIEGPEFDTEPLHEGSCCIRQDQRTRPACEDKKMTKPKNKHVPNMVRKWVPKIATPAKSVDPK
jgi:hypothetical protein